MQYKEGDRVICFSMTDQRCCGLQQRCCRPQPGVIIKKLHPSDEMPEDQLLSFFVVEDYYKKTHIVMGKNMELDNQWYREQKIRKILE